MDEMNEIHESRTDGDCFVVAAQIGTRFQPDEIVDDVPRRDVRIVHGLPVGRGTLNGGRRYWHAWVEVTHRTVVPPEVVQANPAFAHFDGEIVTELVVDRSNGQDLVMPRAMYYNVGQLDEDHVWRYEMDEANDEFTRTGNYGPWVDGWESMEEV